ncbi:thioredoxin-like protein [Macrolepiota fuliginosa MF-IS2]|uniref:Thioredoxin-like protein n=1 Tax=Macrolepiota fuliginosa MF-IS2 TaxID=1400762 RepID=A0A9P6BY57_9AGAR|nr:thioredoxin-like protein [Macrolepiota fuliginosa MF-IS2]
MSLLRRTSARLFVLFCVLLALAWSFGFSWELPESWKDTGIMTSSRARIAQAFSTKKVSVDEIYGLLHLVTGDSDESQHVLTNKVELDPTKPITLDVYAAGSKNLNWDKEMKRLNTEFPVVVFSKTYCPYSKKAKNLLATYDLEPPVKVIEVDLRDDWNVLKALLTRLTHHSTFPNIIVRGKSLGGSDDLQALHATKSLVDVFKKAGVYVRNKNNQ